jgi:hypothetical protein
MTPIVLGPSRGRLALLLLVALAFVFGGVFILLVGHDLRATLTGWSSIVFFGACAAVFVVQLLDARPRVVIDDAGVFDRSLRVGVIPWREILGAEVREAAQNRFIALRLRDPHKFTSRLGAVHRGLAQTNTALGFEPLNLNLSAVDAYAYALAELIGKQAELRRETDGTYRAL